MLIFYCICSLVVVNVLASEHGTCSSQWSYSGAHGPDQWYKKNPRCSGNSQSPINIDDDDVSSPKRENLLIYNNYYNRPRSSMTYKLSNNGHALIYTFPSENINYLRKGSQKYIPMQAHLHFGSMIRKGSEHTLDGRHYQAEIHIVHRNAKYSAEVAGKKADGLLVVGVFVKKEWRKSSSVIHDIANSAKQLRRPGSSKQVKAFPLSQFLPRSANLRTTPYVNYKGSLTTPPCSENVDWIVLTDRTLTIHAREIVLLSKVLGCGGTKMYGNNRPVQRKNGRRVVGVQMGD